MIDARWRHPSFRRTFFTSPDGPALAETRIGSLRPAREGAAAAARRTRDPCALRAESFADAAGAMGAAANALIFTKSVDATYRLSRRVLE